ncbi:prephenate dehydratase domain-containing protein, partial [Haemophilus influenzae]|uniref:prephenate dehydratase domain-containing protein n=1 Tax=Haemophilus influenzae TaxID=727 RepID=UPI003C6CBCD1
MPTLPLMINQYAARYQKQFVELGCQSFEQVFEKVQTGESDFGVLPLENTTSG